jgi:hypothetical protein
MPRYRVDGALTNLPEETTFVDIIGKSTSGGFGFGDYNEADGTFFVNIDNAQSDDNCWLTITAEYSVFGEPIQTLAIKTVGPYLISDVGVVVP